MSFLSSASGAPPEQAPESTAETTIKSALPADAPPAAPADAPPPPLDEALACAARDRKDMTPFVGANFAVFVRPPDAARGAGRVVGAICWPGLLFPTPWFLYRKMYGWAAITVFMPVLFSLVHLPIPSDVMRWISFVSAALGAFGKPLYRAKARRTIRAIRAAAPDEASARETIARAGGVSNAGAAFGLLLLIAFFAFAYLRA